MMRRSADYTTIQATTSELFDRLRAEYDISRDGPYMPRMRGVASMGSHADYHHGSESRFLRSIERARDFDRNNMVVGQGVSRLIRNVLQDGMRLDPKTSEPELNQELGRLWRRWADDPAECDLAAEYTVHELAGMALRSVIVDGDTVILPTSEGSIEMIEAHRVRTPNRTRRNIVYGVLLNESRRRLAYFVTREDVAPQVTSIKLSDMREIAARDGDGMRQVLQLVLPKRVSQTRGVSAMAPIVHPIHLHDDLQFAMLIKAQVSAAYAILKERPADYELPVGTAEPRGEITQSTLADGSTRTISGVAPGMEYTGLPGEHLTGFTPGVPNPEFFPHATMILTLIAVNLDLPVHVLLLDASKTNFSGWRGAVDQARIGMRALQEFMIRRFYRPLYLWKLGHFLAADPALRAKAEKLGPDLYEHRWIKPTWNYIEPSKDAKADDIIVAKRLNSRRNVLAKNGLDIDDVDRDTIEDNKRMAVMALDAAREVNEQYPEARLDWRELAQFPVKDPDPDGESNERGGANEDDAEDMSLAVSA